MISLDWWGLTHTHTHLQRNIPKRFQILQIHANVWHSSEALVAVHLVMFFCFSYQKDQKDQSSYIQLTCVLLPRCTCTCQASTGSPSPECRRPKGLLPRHLRGVRQKPAGEIVADRRHVACSEACSKAWASLQFWQPAKQSAE